VLHSRCFAAAQSPPPREDLPGFARRFSEGTGPYTVSHGVPINETDRNPPFLTNQDWHISGSYGLEKIAEIGSRQQADVDAIIERTDEDKRCGPPPRLLAKPSVPRWPLASSPWSRAYLPISSISRTRAATQGGPVCDKGVHAARVWRAGRRQVRAARQPRP
jgi:hypothetical protein